MFLLHDMLVENAARTPDRPALIQGAEIVTHAALARRTSRMAGELQRRGICPDGRVVLIAGNSARAVEGLWAVLLAGGVVVPVAPESSAHRLRTIVDDCGACAIVSPGECAPLVAAAVSGMGELPQLVWTTAPPGGQEAGVLRDAADDPAARHERVPRIDQDLALIIYTSGTTGEPKGVMLTHRNVMNTTGAIATYLDQGPHDVTCCVLPLAFSYGLFQVLTAARAGSTVLLESSFAFPFDVFARIEKHRATMLPGVPTIFAKLLQLLPLQGVDVGSLRWMTNAAAPIPPAHVLRLREALPEVKFCAMYGQTECTRATYLDPGLAESHPGSVGGPIPNCETYLVDDHGYRLPHGSEGELVVRGSNVMRGYWGRPSATDEKLREGPITGEKVLHTGDRFRTDSRGLLYFVSRTDDIFKCRGEKVAPSFIEHVICELSEVAEAAVVGVEDATDGMAIKAFIVPSAGSDFSEARLRRHCRARLEPALMPRFIEVRESLPKTESGKLRRRDLHRPSSP